MKKILKDLSQEFGPSGLEDKIREKVRSYFKRAGLKTKSDRIGNIWGICEGKSKKVLMIEAHMDEIALMVSYFETGGFIRFSTVGGFDPKIFPGLEVLIYGDKPIKGIITSVPPHLQTGDSRKAWPMKELFVDTGLSESEARRRIKVGDYISLPKNFIELKNSRFAGTSFDNRLGVTLLVDIANSLKKKPDLTVVFAATFGEEIGLRGGKTSSYSIRPDIGICIDVSFGDYPGQNGVSTALGKGPIISIGPVYHPLFIKLFQMTAKSEKIKYQQEVEARPGGTNAGPMQLNNSGIPVAGISIPIRNMHTPSEVVDLNDLKSASGLIQKTIYKLKPDFLEKIKCY